jgi:nucleolar protein TMA23
MNANAFLTAQGWRGNGHSLHATDDNVGLAKPILVARKTNKHGVGNNQHFTSDQWWLDAFDEQIKGLDTSQEGKVVQTVTAGRLNVIDTGVGKYSCMSFVRGDTLGGSFPTSEALELSPAESPETTSEPDEQIDTAKAESKEERRTRREARRERKVAKAARKSGRATAVPALGRQATKMATKSEDRRSKKEAKRARKLDNKDQG